MAELTLNATQPKKSVGPKTGGTPHKAPSKDAGTSPLNSPQPLKQLIFVRYLDHVLYNRSNALSMKPQIREAVGWIIYNCERYIILAWDRDADPPTLTGGDPKASGLVLLKSDILELQLLKTCPQLLQKSFNWNLNCKPTIQEGEYAFRPTERKTHSSKGDKPK
ncbi:MAG: hypothetical protein NWF01_07200 [Candidatus Bathyarchaeota archaeon]|nr:hypothetical protein [Candidatus Bathyarchaeota archaeon]